jgi:hypothetical protein
MLLMTSLKFGRKIGRMKSVVPGSASSYAVVCNSMVKSRQKIIWRLVTMCRWRRKKGGEGREGERGEGRRGGGECRVGIRIRK